MKSEWEFSWHDSWVKVYTYPHGPSVQAPSYFNVTDCSANKPNNHFLKNVHLTLLTQYYPPEIGAPQTRLSGMVDHFLHRGHSVTVLTAMPNYPTGKIYPGYGGMLRRENNNGLTIVRTFIYPTQSPNLLPRLTNYFSFTLSSATLGSFLLGPTNYLLVESPPLFLGLAGIWLSRLKRARLIFNVSDLWPESAVRLGMLESGTMAHRISVRIEAFCYRQAWLITGQSKGILTDIQSRFPDSLNFHFSNGVDTQVFHPERKNQQAREMLQGGKGCVVLYAGLHGLAQGLDQVLDAANLFRKEPAIKFVFVGDGPKKGALMEQAHKSNLTNVCFHESRPAKEIPALLAAADIVLVTLKGHIPGAVPSKLYEAMASGRPVILVASGEAAEIVRQHQTGIVVDPGDIASLAQAVRTLDAQPELRRIYGENGRRVAVQYFDRKSIVSRFIEHLEVNL